MCRYCNANSTEKEMCVACKRRYTRLSLNRSKLLRTFSSADAAKVTNKILDDLSEYRQLQEAGCAIPPVVAEAMEQFKDVERPGNVCGYCGNKTKQFHGRTRMCEDCYKFYNYFNVLYYGPKRPLAYKTRQAYANALLEIDSRRGAGLKIPGIAARALQEDAKTLQSLKKGREVLGDEGNMETRAERNPKVNASIRRKSEPIP